MKIVGYHYNTQKCKDIVESFTYGVEKLGHSTRLIKIPKNRPARKVKADYYICLGLSNIDWLLHNKNLRKLLIVDPPIRGYKFKRSVDDYYGIFKGFPPHHIHKFKNLPDNRWNRLKEVYDIKVKPWNLGKKIVIAYKSVDDHMGNSRESFYKSAIENAKRTGREIVVCDHPNHRKYKKYKRPEEVSFFKRSGCSFGVGIKDYLSDAYCLISSGGSSVAEAVLDGVPVFSSEKCITSPLFKSMELRKFLKKPPTPNRNKWFNWVAYQQWTPSEMKDYMPWGYLYNE